MAVQPVLKEVPNVGNKENKGVQLAQITQAFTRPSPCRVFFVACHLQILTVE